jgi:hypothetical protein
MNSSSIVGEQPTGPSGQSAAFRADGVAATTAAMIGT